MRQHSSQKKESIGVRRHYGKVIRGSPRTIRDSTAAHSAMFRHPINIVNIPHYAFPYGAKSRAYHHDSRSEEAYTLDSLL